ncbi:MAG TPA: chemotaxis protein CheW [Burkholderiaceae bacterium]|nr:chemotaxis protein CheW [Burkholderiaceae bacterium]
MMPRSAAQLRQAFDQAFAEPPRARQGPSVDLLAISICGDAYALPLGEIAGLFADKQPTPLPTAVPAFLGLAGLGSGVVPVYDLRALLGYAGGGAPRWLVVLAARPVALAFDGFDGHLRLAQARIAAPERSGARPHVRGLAQDRDALRTILDLASVLGAIEQLANGAISPSPPE